MGILVYMYFNMQALHHTQAMPDANDWEKYDEYLESLPALADGSAQSLNDVYQQACEDVEAVDLS